MGRDSTMKRHHLQSYALLALLALLVAAPAAAQSGKIAGAVTGLDTGESIPGANVVIEGTTRGTATNAEGYYVILNVEPGTYSLRASFIGMTAQVVQDVRVNIDQTTTVNFELGREVIEGEEVVVTAERRLVQPDVSGSQINITAEEVATLPVTSVAGAVGLQAGVEGLSIRGGGSSGISFMLNGLLLRNTRNNTPFTRLPLSSVQEIQVKTGGFNAEYGTVRSGVINVVTKDGPSDHYAGEVNMRYSPPDAKHFGIAPNDGMAYFIRPFVDPEVAWTGTDNGAWTEATQNQYPEFEGWIAKSDVLLKDEDPTNDMTPAALQQAFLWQHRKEFAITQPDYTMDVGFGGPVPVLNSALGDLRFYGSYRRNQNMYIIPLSRDRIVGQTGHLKVTSNPAPTMELSLDGLWGQTTGTSASQSGQPGIFSSAFGITGNIDRVSYSDARIFTESYWAPTRVNSNMLGGTFTHTLGSDTYYEVRLTRFAADYLTNPGDFRDTTDIVSFGGVGFNEAPYGYFDQPTEGAGSGMRMSIGMSTSRDSSRVVLYNGKADLTSQLNQYLLFKTGVEFNLNHQDMNYGSFDPYLPTYNYTATWSRYPRRGAAYPQSKLEFQGMVVNAGLRLDYFSAGGEWYVYEPFTDAFTAANAGQIDTLLAKEPTANLLELSPRLGVSFPVTEYSKLFFNYGHLRSVPDADHLFVLRYEGLGNFIGRIGSPNNPLPKTIAYELGYEHALFEQFLIRAAGYYKDIVLQPRLVSFFSRDGKTEYSRYFPNSYEDVRGFEISLYDQVGWLQGFVNYTYMLHQYGYFGADEIYQNQTLQRQFENSRAQQRAALAEPLPRPYARFNLEILLPDDFGPSLAGLHPLGDLRMSLLGNWRLGSKLTWTGGGSVPGVVANVQLPDYWNWNLRLTKNFSLGGTDAQVYIDAYNLFNARRLTFNGFVDGQDYLAYMNSLHLPESEDYPNPFVGDDQPGDYREPGVDYVPMEHIGSREIMGNTTPEPDVIYYEASSDQYLSYENGSWEEVDRQLVDEVIESKAYIDMPNFRYQSFLNPRDVYFGVRFTF